MAVTHTEVQIQWAAANSVSVAAAGSAESDVVAIDTAAVEGLIHLKAKNDGAPAAGDEVTFKILFTGGDPDGTGTDEYDSANHAAVLAVLDTNSEDPALKSVPIPVGAKSFKIRAENGAGTNGITVSATFTEVRA